MPKDKSNVLTIKVESNACGKEILKPACKRSLIFTLLTRNKSLTESDLELIISLGYELEFK